MKNTIFRFGIYSSALMVTCGMINLFIVSRIANYSMQEVSGYLTMFISMIFVFMGILHYRDIVNGGFLSFGRGLQIGLLIVLIPSIAFGLFDLLYTQVINPGWLENYYTHYIEQIKINTPPDKLAEAINKASQEKQQFSNPLILFLVMSGTVFIIGFIVTIISTLALRRNLKLNEVVN